MFVNGVDITKEAGIICSAAWIAFYIALIWYIWTRRPITLDGRRWKASWLISGLPVLGMPLIAVLILFFLQFFQGHLSVMDIAGLYEKIQMIFTTSMILTICLVPLAIPMAFLATLGTYFNFRTMLDYWLDKIVPPSKDEKTDSEVWY